MNPNLGLLIFFEGNFRKVKVAMKNITSFTSVSAKLMSGDQDVSSTYITSTITSQGNMILTDIIGGKAAMPAGNYRYFISGVYGGKAGTWFFDILVLPLNADLIHEIPEGDYDPLVADLTYYEGDKPLKSLTIPGVNFSAVTGVFTLGSDTTPTATYCNGAANYSGDTLSTHNIGGLATIPASDYGYFLTGTYDNGEAKTTYYYRLKFLPKQSII